MSILMLGSGSQGSVDSGSYSLKRSGSKSQEREIPGKRSPERSRTSKCDLCEHNIILSHSGIQFIFIKKLQKGLLNVGGSGMCHQCHWLQRSTSCVLSYIQI